jgi:rhodanese-related sulfurtransferase
MRLTLNQRLGLAAVALGALAVFADVDRGPVLAFHEKDLLATIQQEADHVAPSDLAAWIIEGRRDYRLLDLRDEKAYGEYHVPTAESVPIEALRDAVLLPNEKLVLYSDGGIHAAQAWMLLRARGHRAAYTLRGGLDAWKETVLFPAAPADPRAVAVATFFGGAPRGGASGPAPALQAPVLPKVEAAPPPRAGAAPARRKKEGC